MVIAIGDRIAVEGVIRSRYLSMVFHVPEQHAIRESYSQLLS